MRICAVVLPELRVEVLRGAHVLTGEGEREGERDAVPLGIVVAPPPMTEEKLLGQTRLDVVSREARRLGISAGQTIAQARARASNLAVRVVRPEAVRRALGRLSEVALSFGATVSFAEANDDASSFGDVVWVDVTGCAHLHAPDRLEGEKLLATRLASAVAALGHVCAVAIADGPRVAATLARELATLLVSSPSPRAGAPRHVMVVPPGKSASVLRTLPITALPLLPEDTRWLTQIGVRTIEELRALPRTSLATRLGKHAPAVFAIADGEDHAPLDPYIPPEIPEEDVAFEVGIEGAEALVFVAKMLADRMAHRLAGRGMAASRLELELALDAALVRGLGDGQGGSDEASATRTTIALDLPSPLARAKDLLAALRPKIERIQLAAPALSAKLRVPALAHRTQAALSLFDPVPKASLVLPRLVAELAADLGDTAVGKLALGDAWLPEERTRLVKLSDKSGAGRSRRKLLSSVSEPTRILDTPIRVAKQDLGVVRRLSRLEAVAWWKDASNEPESVAYVQAWVDEGLAWVEIDRATGATYVRGWFD